MIVTLGLLLAAGGAVPAVGPSPPEVLPADTVPAACRLPFVPPGGGVGDPWGEELRIRELAGEAELIPDAGTLRRGSELTGRARECPDGFRLLPFAFTARYRSDYPDRDREGLLWAGRGGAWMVEGGAAYRQGPVSVALRPQIARARNRDFDHPQVGVPDFGVFIHPWHPTQIDWPLRPGDERIEELHPGESHLRVELRGVAAGLSTERLRWGPARRNPVVLGGGGPGFPHLFLGPSGPVEIPGGTLEGELVWGRLAESDHFYEEPPSRDRHFGGVELLFRPRGSRSLQIGVTHAHVEDGATASTFVLDQLLAPFLPVTRRELGRLDRLQLGSVHFRYLLAENSTEIYGEWGRRDLWADAFRLRSLTRGDAGFTFGFQHLWTGHDTRVRVHGEFTSLRTTRALADGGRPTSFYVHSRVRHGFTHRGRLLGAPIGPGSDAQALGVDVDLGDHGRVGLLAERVRTDDDTYFRTWAPFVSFRGHDVEHTLSVPFTFRRGGLEVRGTLSRSWRRNRHFTGFFRGMGTGDVLKETNDDLRIQVIWHP